MAREKVDNKLNVVIGTKAQIEGDTSIPENSIIVVTDEELKAEEIVYNVEKNVKEAIEDLEGLNEEIDTVRQDLEQYTDNKVGVLDTHIRSNYYDKNYIDDLEENITQHVASNYYDINDIDNKLKSLVVDGGNL